MRAKWAAAVVGLGLLGCNGDPDIKWADGPVMMTEPFIRDIDGTFATDIYVTGYPTDETPGAPDERTWCQITLGGVQGLSTHALQANGLPLPPPIVLDRAGGDLERPVTPDYFLSPDSQWFFNSETWPEVSGQGVLLMDVWDYGDDMPVFWFSCEAVLPLSPLP